MEQKAKKCKNRKNFTRNCGGAAHCICKLPKAMLKETAITL